MKDGDIVQLKSGGPAMTISGKGLGDTWHCIWFTANNEMKRENIAESSLCLYEE